MDSIKLDRWAQQLLDTGKRNNLINYKDSKSSSAEVVFPSADDLYNRCLSSSSFEIFDPKISVDEINDEDDVPVSDDIPLESAGKTKKSEYVSLYKSRIRRNNQVLVYSNTPNPITAIKNIDKKSRSFLEETGVNVAYLAFGFVYWKENIDSSLINRAPLLLVPITLRNESSISPYYIELTEDDVVVNPTFNYLLSAQYGITLPEYEDDESLQSYLDKVSQLVSKLHWEVVSECKIGIFSFLKINMYYDLKKNADTILKNNNVRLLLGESIEAPSSNIEPSDNKVSNEVIDLHTIVDADSSQIEAIEMTKSGKSFVLQGPPGTGKSQTITNIIAECLHDGKKVLFVSEKLAALNVVYDKLKQAGLEDFCLELHSHKANKKEVIAELCRTLRSGRTTVSARADMEIQEKAKLQKQLDSYAEELHKPIPSINMSMFQLYEAYAANRDGIEVDVIWNNINNKGEEYLLNATSLLEQYAEYVPTIGVDYKQNEWYGYKNQNGSYEVSNRLKYSTQAIVSGLNDLIPKTSLLNTTYAFNLKSISDTEIYIHLLVVLSTAQFLRPESLKQQNLATLIPVAKEMEELSAQIIEYRKQLNNRFESTIYELNGAEIYNKLTKLYSGLFSRLTNAEYKKIITDIRLASKTGKKPSYKDAVECMQILSNCQYLTSQFDYKRAEIGDGLVTNRLSVDADWNQLTNELEAIRTCYDNELTIGNIVYLSDSDFENSKMDFSDHAKELSLSVSSFKNLIIEIQNDFDRSIISFDVIPLDDLLARMQMCMYSSDKIENWIRFSILLKQLEAQELDNFIDCIIARQIPRELVVSSFKRAFYKQWINQVIHANPVLSNFTRISQDKAVEQFAKKDALQFEISKAQIRAELSAKRPSLDITAGGSAVSILLREGEKKRKQKSIRKLLKETGDLIQVIKPCFLMSPLSVSTFLNDNDISFDTIVFDEASQIFPWDAIGSVYRGKQLIVVGDSRQMPPSNFFNTSVDIDDDDEETGDVTDFESILDLCSTSLSQLRLKWHYRSRYEPLIAFSNRNFYENSLITFPSSSVDRKGIGVDYYYVDGLFDRKSHTNKAEAEFVVDLVFKNIEDYPDRSLGVVAFSLAQQDLIDKLISKRRQDDSSKEWFFKRDETTKEPFFVKNLETVQGDERDTIIFSIAYGKDSQGRLYHNFGPLNRVGGERRLNVAVTRAKCNVQLVSSMHSTDIDLSRTSAEGARLLREYLDYAEHGEIALERSVSVSPFEQFDSDFEVEVCEFLRSHGFSVDMQVGCSGFKIDIGLKQPDSSDYVLAIECDGATYHSSKNARDRDKLRQEILERMGWRFYRIWSTDWFMNNAVEKERLLKAATEAIQQGHYVSNEANDDELVSDDEVVESSDGFEQEAQPKHLVFQEYKSAPLNDLYKANNYHHLAFIASVVNIEAPISEEFLLKRICAIYDREKVTNVVWTMYYREIGNCSVYGITRRNGFLYKSNDYLYPLRVPGVKREIKYIALEELAGGMLVIMNQNMTADKDGLFKSVASLLGFSRMGDTIRERLDLALDHLVKGNYVTVDNDIISINK